MGRQAGMPGANKHLQSLHLVCRWPADTKTLGCTGFQASAQGIVVFQLVEYSPQAAQQHGGLAAKAARHVAGRQRGAHGGQEQRRSEQGQGRTVELAVCGR